MHVYVWSSLKAMLMNGARRWGQTREAFKLPRKPDQPFVLTPTVEQLGGNARINRTEALRESLEVGSSVDSLAVARISEIQHKWRRL